MIIFALSLKKVSTICTPQNIYRSFHDKHTNLFSNEPGKTDNRHFKHPTAPPINARSNISKISEKPKEITEKKNLDLLIVLLRHYYLPVKFFGKSETKVTYYLSLKGAGKFLKKVS